MSNSFFVQMALWGLICGASMTAFGKDRMDYKLRVAVIDTGIDPKSDVPQCPNTSEDFTGTGLQDVMGHGTHVSDIIDQYVKLRVRMPTFFNFDLGQFNNKYDYCQMIFKFYNPYEGTDPAEKLKHDTANVWNTVMAFRKAIAMGADVINYSAGGNQYDANEKKIVEQALERGITVVVAAGNEGRCLGNGEVNYPASYDRRIVVVGNKLPQKPKLDAAAWSHRGACTVPEGVYRSQSSNYGPTVNAWEVGTDVMGRTNGGFGTMTGTSQACAVRSGKIIRQKLERR